MLPARSPPPSEDPRYLGTPASMGFARSTAAGIGFSHQRGSAHLDTRRQRTTHRRQPHHTTCEARRTSASSRTLNALRLHTTPLEMLPTTFLSRLSRDSPESLVESQRDRCYDVFSARHAELLSRLSNLERVLVTEAASQIGRKWLSVLPTMPLLRLTDVDISAALHARTLTPSAVTFCRHCEGTDFFAFLLNICSGNSQIACI